MIRNYIKTAWRNLVRNKFYSLLNIAGLTTGLAIGILILLWVQDELSFDSFHRQSAHIYRLDHYGGTGSSKQIYNLDVAPIGPLAKQQLPEVEDQVRITGNFDYSLYKYRDKLFGNEAAIYADPSFFSVFDFRLISGDASKPFNDDHSVVITKSTAEKYFGKEEPVGKTIVADDKENFTVTGVINDMPKNSTMKFSMIMPMSFHIKTMLASGQDLNSDFGFLNYQTYLLLQPGADPKTVAAKIFQIHKQHQRGATSDDYLLLPLSKMHLYNADMSDNGISTVRIFALVALLILVIACINYINLSTARAMLRSKEISMRKIIGASKKHLFAQFMIETGLLLLLASGLALVIIQLLMPVFNQVAGKQLVLNLGDYHLWLVILAAITGTLAASGVYPALLLSSFEPLKALKGKVSAGIGKVMFRRILVVTQFASSIILIIGVMVITRQLNYIRTKDIGLDKTDVISVWMRDMGSHYDAVKAELLKQQGVLGVTRSNQNIIRYYGFTGNIDWDGKDPKDNLVIHPIVVDKDLVSFFKMKLREGHSFTGAATDSMHYILNEEAVKQMGIKNPIGKRFRMGETNGTIIGVVQDFHYASMKQKIAPSLFWYSPQLLNKMYIKTTRADAQKVIAAVEKQFKQYNGEYPFGYAFLDDIFNSMYQSEQRQGTLFSWFASIAIFISCLGLLGLAAYTAQVRTREIGVRKVLGAGVSSIIALLATDFIRLVLIAIVIATPVAWWAMNSWLRDFAYRVNIGWGTFFFAGIAAVLIAFITISFQSIKAAMANPVESLRSE